MACRKAQRLALRGRMPASLLPMSAHKDSARENYVVLWFLREECESYPIPTQKVVTGDNKEYWART